MPARPGDFLMATFAKHRNERSPNAGDRDTGFSTSLDAWQWKVGEPFRTHRLVLFTGSFAMSQNEGIDFLLGPSGILRSDTGRMSQHTGHAPSPEHGAKRAEA